MGLFWEVCSTVGFRWEDGSGFLLPEYRAFDAQGEVLSIISSTAKPPGAGRTSLDTRRPSS